MLPADGDGSRLLLEEAGGGSAEISEAECQAANEWVPGRGRQVYPSRSVFPMGPPRILGSVAVWCGGTHFL